MSDNQSCYNDFALFCLAGLVSELQCFGLGHFFKNMVLKVEVSVLVLVVKVLVMVLRVKVLVLWANVSVLVLVLVVDVLVLVMETKAW